MPEFTSTRIVIQGCHVATCDSAGTEYTNGYVVIEGGRIASVGAGVPPAQPTA